MKNKPKVETNKTEMIRVSVNPKTKYYPKLRENTPENRARAINVIRELLLIDDEIAEKIDFEGLCKNSNKKLSIVQQIEYDRLITKRYENMKMLRNFKGGDAGWDYTKEYVTVFQETPEEFDELIKLNTKLGDMGIWARIYHPERVEKVKKELDDLGATYGKVKRLGDDKLVVLVDNEEYKVKQSIHTFISFVAMYYENKRFSAIDAIEKLQSHYLIGDNYEKIGQIFKSSSKPLDRQYKKIQNRLFEEDIKNTGMYRCTIKHHFGLGDKGLHQLLDDLRYNKEY